MPLGDPDSAIVLLLEAERAIRMGQSINLRALKLASYWKDLVRLLQIFSLGQAANNGKVEKIYQIKRDMASDVYDIYIDTFYKRQRAKPKPTALPQQMQLEALDTEPHDSSFT